MQLKNTYTYLYILLACVYIAGLFIPLMENDSAQHATMAMRMYLENDFLNIYKGANDYLDKPHMHFWLAALSFKIFGLYDWAYRIPALLFTILGAFSCFKLTKHIYKNETAAHYSSLIFLAAQAIILSNHDVRTDAVLTGATIFSIWQLITYIDTQKLANIILGFMGAGVAFATKGQLGVLVIFVCVMSQLLYVRKVKLLLSYKVLVGLLTFVVSIFPVLYAYYHQFDIHPEKLVNGTTGNSGVRFILWDQSFNRLTASGFSKTSSDYSFFFHTLLWAFLPWAIIMYIALFTRIKTLINNKFTQIQTPEIFSSVGFLIVLIIISFSKFKLPHYLNSLLPVASILVATYVLHLQEKQKASKNLYITQIVILVLLVVLGCVLVFYPFDTSTYWYFIVFTMVTVVLFVLYRKKLSDYHQKIIVYSVLVASMVNFGLNTHFYPNLLKYRAGNNAAKFIKEQKIHPNDIALLNGSWALNFYVGKQLPHTTVKHLLEHKPHKQWLFLVGKKQLQELTNNGLRFTEKHEFNHYRITKLTGKFLNPKKRASVLEKGYLLKLR